ncbi:GtrA family protein [Litorihabitans aurantiacus]|uniref:GtrA/DPMS transmembrane domain-containing protein n=1 Tax=Litorihabitans aurantiacus TaxID=1930061 RepID=A0AA37XDQ6_9MICO|nr:GtrA family protein [Litorihabitans aurantiacus]GMA30602.1 hypothetical protein GCM10025875_05940 [Litorihabitans aurantiacus]
MTGTVPAPGSDTAPEGSRGARPLVQLIRFAVVGGIGVVVNMAVAIAMNRLNGGTRNAQEVLLAIPGTDLAVRFTAAVWIVGFAVSVVVNYQLNRSWTFRGVSPESWWSGLWRFVCVGAAAAVVGLALKIALTNPTSPVHLSQAWFTEDVGLRSREYWAQLIAIALTVPLNFLVNRAWTFRRRRS